MEPGLSSDPSVLYAGGPIGNSGAQAINLAAHAGAWRILLLGFDMQRGADGEEHFFGDHPSGLLRGSPYEQFVKGMWAMAAELHARGIEVLNGNPDSRLPYFRKLTPAELDDLCRPD